MKSISDYPEYQAALDKLAGLQHQLAAVNQTITDLTAQIGHNQKPGDSITAKAEALLDGEDGPVSVTRLRRELDESIERRKVLEASIRLQQNRVEQIKTTSSEAANTDLEKPYRAAVRKALDAAVKQSQSFAEVRDMIEGIQEAGFYFHQQQLAMLGRYGRWDDPDAHIHALLQDAEREGFIKPSDYPDRPKRAGEYDNMPKGATVTALAAGPNGLREVKIAQGGKVVNEKVIHQPEDQKAAADGWG